VDFPIKNGGFFHSYVTVYQRIMHLTWIAMHDFCLQLLRACASVDQVVPIPFVVPLSIEKQVADVADDMRSEELHEFFMAVSSST